jgi:hypothetical protein
VQPYKFQFEITKRKGSTIEGEMTWPELNNAKTKVKGTIEGDEVQFEEYETQSEDVLVPVGYTGKFPPGNKKMIAGKFKGSATSGIFEMLFK